MKRKKRRKRRRRKRRRKKRNGEDKEKKRRRRNQGTGSIFYSLQFSIKAGEKFFFPLKWCSLQNTAQDTSSQALHFSSN